MSALDKAISVARGEIGYLEKASNAQLYDKTANPGTANYTKYGEWYGWNGVAWCAIFVSWVLYMAGVLANAGGKFAYVPYWVEWFQAQGRYRSRGSYTPQAGDIIFFRNSSHVGLVESCAGGYVTTIEGNTSAGSALVTNGQGVERKCYSVGSSYIMGYGVMDYGEAPQVEKITQLFPEPKTYCNGFTDEICYADTALTVRTGSLNPWEQVPCLGVVDGRYMVYYTVDGTDHHKVGFVAYDGGISLD